MANIVKGSTTGTGAAINISIGFEPVFVLISNRTDADQLDLWFTGMAAGTSIQINTAVATRATNGVTLYTGSATAGRGFTIGSGISENLKVLDYIAIGVLGSGTAIS